MGNKLTDNNYISILRYYNIIIPTSKKQLQLRAEQIMGEKLCRCIKKLEPIHKSKSIGICTKTIFNNKGLTRGNFTCKRGRSVYFTKGATNQKATNKKATNKKATNKNKKKKKKQTRV